MSVFQQFSQALTPANSPYTLTVPGAGTTEFTLTDLFINGQCGYEVSIQGENNSVVASFFVFPEAPVQLANMAHGPTGTMANGEIVITVAPKAYPNENVTYTNDPGINIFIGMIY